MMLAKPDIHTDCVASALLRPQARRTTSLLFSPRWERYYPFSEPPLVSFSRNRARQGISNEINVCLLQSFLTPFPFDSYRIIRAVNEADLQAKRVIFSWRIKRC